MRTEAVKNKIKEAKRVLAVLLLDLEIDDLSDTESNMLYELARDVNIQQLLGELP